MLRTYLLVALRNLYRHRGYAAVNVLGLATGITCCLLIALFVRHELSYDRHHQKADRIVRVTTEYTDVAFPVTAPIVGPILEREIPEVEEAVRLFNFGIFGSVVVQHEDRMYEENRFFYADSAVFDVFTLPLVAGDPATALNRPRTVVLTRETARKYFADADPLGKTLLVNQDEFEVTGVLAPMTAPSHVEFDFLASFASLGWATQEVWTGANFLTYLLLRDASSLERLPRQIEHLLDRVRAKEQVPSGFALRLEPLSTIRLDLEGRRAYVYLFSAIAVLILLVACANYMNLSTARATQRAKEVGVRKATGAHRWQLVGQFYGESALLSLVGLSVAVVMALLLMPTFRMISGQPLSFSLDDPSVLLGLLATWAVVTLAAGSYPAVLISSFGAAQVLKGTVRSGRGAARFRRALVAFQFAVSVFLLVGTTVIYNQLRYIQTADLGFRGDQVVALPVGDSHTLEALPSVKRRISELPGVVSATAIDRLPGMQPGGYSLLAEGFEVPDGMDYFPLHAVPTEPGVIETLGLELVAGSELDTPEDYQPQDGDFQYLINEATLRVIGWTPEEAIGKRFSVSGDGRWGRVVGVFRDYHFLPLRERVGPLALFVEPAQASNLLVRLAPEDVMATLGRLEAVWAETVPHRPFAYTFLDEAFAAHYESERQLAKIFGGFTLLAILVACFGLLGLAAYAVEQRRREIGVRKVLGASAGSIVMLLSKEFAALVAIGFAIAALLAYPVMSRWLEGFAYRVELRPGIFIVAGATVLLIALATVSTQAVRAAGTDPARTLRTE